MKIDEGKAEIEVPEGVFFNKRMELCRDVSSLAVGAIEEKLDVLDAFCATGVRGIRYKGENENVGKVSFADMSKKAEKAVESNCKKNGMKGCEIFQGDVNEFLFENSFDLVEIDPFGSPVPFLYDAVRSFSREKQGYLSVTATDTAVLCGAHAKACLKNYGSKPLNNEFCHEVGARILLGKIARVAGEFDFGLVPLFTLSRQHYFKVVLKLERGAEKAVESVKKMGIVSWCSKCFEREWNFGFGVREKCSCGVQHEHAGMLWLGGFGRKSLLEGWRS